MASRPRQCGWTVIVEPTFRTGDLRPDLVAHRDGASVILDATVIKAGYDVDLADRQ